jgi:hypothetical protein
MILVWSCPGNMLIYYPGLIDILPSPAVFGRVICLSDLDNILAYYLDKTTLVTYFVINEYEIQLWQYKKYLPLVNWCPWTATENESSAMNARTPLVFLNDKWYDKHHEITDQIISSTQWWPVRTLPWPAAITKGHPTSNWRDATQGWGRHPRTWGLHPVLNFEQ